MADSKQLRLDFAKGSKHVSRSHDNTLIKQLKPTAVFDTYWRFAAERQKIFFRRLRGVAPPWTTDPILAKHKFTNAYRASDRVSQYLIRNVIYNTSYDAIDIVFRILLFKIFNRIETWESLLQRVGEISWRTFSPKRYGQILTQMMKSGEKVYSPAYIMPPVRGIASLRKHNGHFLLLDKMMRDDLALRLIYTGSLREVFELLRSYPGIGDFLAYQYTIDLNYSPILNFSEMEFIIPGPGALRGIQKCFQENSGLSADEIIRIVTNSQDEEFANRGLQFESLWGRNLQLVDCQNLFCEVDKYARVAHPEAEASGRRSRIKQRFHPHHDPLTVWYPPKWGINQRIQKELLANDTNL